MAISKCAILCLIIALWASLTSGQFNGLNLGAGQVCMDGSFREIIPGAICAHSGDCAQRYSYSECDWAQGMAGLPTTSRMCYCRCGYRWDYSSSSCINRDSCWYCSSGVVLAIIITILVIVIVVAVFTIPTCAMVSCFSNKQ